MYEKKKKKVQKVKINSMLDFDINVLHEKSNVHNILMFSFDQQKIGI